MPDIQLPGVYIENVRGGPRPIEGVSTCNAAIVGPTERGPLSPQIVTSWLEFQRLFGGYLPLDQSYTPYAVKGFFDNGGKRLFVARVVGKNAGFAAQDVGPLHIHAIGPGDWGDRIFIRIGKASESTAQPDHFRLSLLYFSAHNMPPDLNNIIDPFDSSADRTDPDYREPNHVEDYDTLTHTIGASNHVATVVNASSQLVRVWLTDTEPVPQDQVTTYTPLSTSTPPGYPINASDFEGDLDPIVRSAPEPDLFDRGQGLAAIGTIDEVNLVMAPDEVNDGISNAGDITNRVIIQCEQLKDRFAIVSTARPAEFQTLHPPEDTPFAAFYYPWIQVFDPVSAGPVCIPPSGHVTGILVRSDNQHGVYKAPANQVVRGATDLDVPVTQAMQEILNPRGVNCIRDFRSQGRGIRLWGARTMSSDPEWRYVNIRRFFSFIEESIEKGTRWVVFEPNGEPLWAKVRLNITNFLVRLWRDGALVGATPEEAFFVRCDRSTMTQNDLDNGRLVCIIGVAPLKPAEFVIFRIGQKTADALA